MPRILMTAVGIGLVACLMSAATAQGLSPAVETALKQMPHPVILMRHAQTVPGTGDPPGFELDDRASQRNLNEVGKAQARRFGEALSAAGVTIGRVLASEWARAEDTARLILKAAGQDQVPIEPFPPLNNVWDGDPTGGTFVPEARAAMSSWAGPDVLLLVSHGVTIRPILGRSALQGGFFVVAPQGDEGFAIVAEGTM